MGGHAGSPIVDSGESWKSSRTPVSTPATKSPQRYYNTPNQAPPLEDPRLGRCIFSIRHLIATLEAVSVHDNITDWVMQPSQKISPCSHPNRNNS